jgi:hypothetical protein
LTVFFGKAKVGEIVKFKNFLRLKPKKRGRISGLGSPPFWGVLDFLSDLFIFFSFYLIYQRLKSAVERLFERFGGTFDEKVVPGNMDPDLRDLVLDGVNDIVQL